jgi:hypothetical protein
LLGEQLVQVISGDGPSLDDPGHVGVAESIWVRLPKGVEVFTRQTHALCRVRGQHRQRSERLPGRLVIQHKRQLSRMRPSLVEAYRLFGSGDTVLTGTPTPAR